MPAWCTGSWCYVNASHCRLNGTAASAYFPELQLSYSYATCGHHQCAASFDATLLSISVPSDDVSLIKSLVGALVAAVVVILLALVLHSCHRRRLRAQLDALADCKLRLASNGDEAVVCPLRDGESFHLFLSHSWMHGQDPMRLVKERLITGLLPGTIEVFLDVDNLDTGRGTEYVDRSQHFVLFLTTDYFESKSCFGELLRALELKKPLTIMVEAEENKHGGISFESALLKLQAACEHAAGTWHLADVVKIPSCDAIAETLRRCRVLAFDRIPAFLDVTLCLLCEPIVVPPQSRKNKLRALSSVLSPKRSRSRKNSMTENRWSSSRESSCQSLSQSMQSIVPKASEGVLHLQASEGGESEESTSPCTPAAQAPVNNDRMCMLRRELVRRKPAPLPLPRGGCAHHVYLSSHNPGASELISELMDQCVAQQRLGEGLAVTSQLSELPRAEHMLICTVALGLQPRTGRQGGLSCPFVCLLLSLTSPVFELHDGKTLMARLGHAGLRLLKPCKWRWKRLSVLVSSCSSRTSGLACCPAVASSQQQQLAMLSHLKSSLRARTVQRQCHS